MWLHSIGAGRADLLSPAEREARTLDAAKRRALLASIGEQLEAHHVYLETAQLTSAGLQKKLARGDCDALADGEPHRRPRMPDPDAASARSFALLD